MLWCNERIKSCLAECIVYERQRKCFCKCCIFVTSSSSQKIKIAALRMYTCCVERVNYDDFFESECTEDVNARNEMFCVLIQY